MTIELCRDLGVPIFQTHAFYERGAVFNKGQAMARFVELTDFLKPERLAMLYRRGYLPATRLAPDF